jgi:tetratricopeptide (TPR) repeat protein
MQSLIREVAYGTLARRDRRARHLAVARHYEALGDDELAGALASHYLAAREASDPGPEADAITGQARLALSGAADRAAALGGYDQAVAYLDQALEISTDPADRAPLFDRAANAAIRAALDPEAYAQGAIDAYRELGDPVATLAATGRLGKVLIEAGEINRALEVLEAASAESATVVDEATRAGILANLARVQMRLGHSVESIAAADEALAIAERLNLEPVVAEALVNKGSALSQLGRRREAIALDEAALRMAQALPNRNFEMRVRNNLASVLGDDDPVRATQIMLESAEVAREMGDRGMYYWLTTQASWGLRAEARDWDEQMERLRGALDTATVRGDRIRLRSFLAGLEATRGEDLSTLEQELEEMLGDSTDPDQHYFALQAMALAALVAGDAETAYLKAERAMGLPMQGAEGAAGLALRAAIWAGDHKGIRIAAAAVIDAPYSGLLSRCFRRAAEGAVAFVDGRPAEAVSAIREATSGLDALGQPFDAAEMAVDAVILMPGDSEIRRIAEEHRSVLESVGARPDIERLDAALAATPVASPAAAAIAVEAPTSGS